MTNAAPSYATWHADPRREAAMGNAHAPLWRHFIEAVQRQSG
jgi:hypothetical protein